jgi:hypothetical protein
MLRKLAVESLRADLASVDALLKERTPDEDPIGWFQFSQRQTALRRKLEEVQNAETTSAGVALFFGGRPVLGSRGINADFGAKAVDQFQSVVATQFALQNGPIGARGPVRQRERAQLMITDVVRGSFGFVLEENNPDHLVNSSLKHVVDGVLDIIYRTAAPDEAAFDSVTETVDDRLLGTLKSFFKHLDDAGATMRVVEDEREFTLGSVRS